MSYRYPAAKAIEKCQLNCLQLPSSHPSKPLRGSGKAAKNASISVPLNRGMERRAYLEFASRLLAPQSNTSTDRATFPAFISANASLISSSGR